ncbi:hypothetical protein T484DRAFT_1826678 [Baffinella frigidus]|nr:hypothetical protein T484DRAFT_1826678 [Cryptophyta sp. CCMP2293]
MRGTEEQNGGSPATMKKRKTEEGPAKTDIEEKGARMVLGFLEEFAALPLDSLTPADACAKVLALRNKVP